ncbi:MAG: hypothetical protein Q8K31_02535 [Burkholderiaceae bacterium]|nr:hypothetical protein [Burkholderiaceae bacterium]MDO9090495.1 hypothetical protein [Burkholderiaceae bacterium]MDP1968046.1 hypothetical protein [Burkholderiaceae bacterium]
MGKLPCWISSAFVLPLLSLLTALSATAQERAAAAPPPAATAAHGYRSAFNGYQRFDDEAVQSWKDSNATVERIGGWRAYARQVQAPAPAPSSAGKAGKAHEGHARP